MTGARTCGDCHMCCKVFPIPEADKPHTGWCPHLDLATGCTRYETRPETCRKFFCAWLHDKGLCAAWRPDKAGFVLSDPDPWALLVTCDPDHPHIWRREPYESCIRAWADEAGRRGLITGVREGERLCIILRDRDVEVDAAAAGRMQT